MKALLIDAYSPPSSTAGAYSSFLEPMPPIAIAYVAGALEAGGHEVVFYDQVADRGDPSRLEATLKRVKPDMVGLSAVTPSAAANFRTAEAVRRILPGVPIVMGNIHADIFYRSILERGLADVVVHGEGEVTAVELANTLERGGDLAEIQGISFLRDGDVVRTPNRAFVQDMDSLPRPAWHLFPTDGYRIFAFARVREPGTLINGSRGCPYACTFCSLKIMGHKRRVRSARSLVDEIEWLHGQFGYQQVSFTDPIFPITRKEGLAFCEEMVRRGLHEKVVWVTETRVDNVDPELLEAMYEAGCRRIMYGFETGDEHVLDSIKKNFSLERAREAARWSRQAGIQVIGFFMIGMPHDTPERIRSTIDFACRAGIDFAKFTVFVPYPGTDDYALLNGQGDWVETGFAEDETIWERFTSYPTKQNVPIYIAPALTNEHLIRLQKLALLKFYANPKMLFHHLVRVRSIKLSEMVKGAAVILDLPRLATA